MMQARERSHSLSIPGMKTVRTPCTPTFSTHRESITNFVDFNPAGQGNTAITIRGETTL
jgi:hypothetical protein